MQSTETSSGKVKYFNNSNNKSQIFGVGYAQTKPSTDQIIPRNHLHKHQHIIQIIITKPKLDNQIYLATLVIEN